MKLKLAAIGLAETTSIYKLLGAECYAVSNAKEAEQKIMELAKMQKEGTEEPVYGVIFVEEHFHADLSDDTIEKLTKRALPSVIPLPNSTSKKGKHSYGVKRLSTIVERAVGSDIFS